MSIFRSLSAAATLLGLAVAVPAAAQVARVENTASLSYAGEKGTETVRSNTVSLNVDRTKRPTSLGFRLLPVGYQLSGMKCETTPTLRYTPAPIDAATLAQAPVLDSADEKTPTILVLDAKGENHDPNVRDTAWIKVEAGPAHLMLPLLETGNDTGVFAGGIPERGANPQNAACDVRYIRGATIRLSFTEDEYSYASEYSMLIDPAGYIFDSETGALINGAEISLYDENENLAKVYGDDGVIAYPSTVISGSTVHDASGREYKFPRGNYRFPLTHPGRYHLHIKPPADYVAPSTRARAELEKLRDPTGQPFILNDASFEGVFELLTPDPFFADIPLDRVGDTKLLLTKTASVREASPGDFVQYRVTIANRSDHPATDVHLTDILPRGLRYEKGSERGVGPAEIAKDGRTLTFTVPTIAARSSLDVTYVVSVAPGAPTGEAVNRVLASGANGLTGNEAAASVRLRPLLFTDGFTVIGRVTEGACGDPAKGRKGVPNIRIMLEDGTFVVTDKDGLYHLEGIRPGRHVVQLDKGSVPASLAPVACDADTRTAGSATSRFVESEGGLLKRVDFQLRPTGKTVAVTAALPIEVASDKVAAGNRDWFAGQTAGIAMLFPEVDHNPRAPALRVVIKHLTGQRVALTVNGNPTDPLAFDATDPSPDGSFAISRWSGLPLVEGDNRIHARVLAADGSEVAVLDRVVHSSSIPARAEFVADKSRLIADGVTRPLIAVRVTDRAGRPVRDGTLIPFQVDQPYTAAIEAALEQQRQLVGMSRAATTARVMGDEGLAFITLQPTTQAGAVHATVSLTEEKVVRTSDIRAWLSAAAQEWKVVGFGAGTFGYDVLKKHGRSLPASERGGVVTDGQLAFYAKGRVKGSWLLTIAYDSDRQRDRDRGLLGTIDPDRYYTVYGDGTRQGYDAATERKLYLRLERREFYALFGDFETGLTQTQLGRYSRTLNGVKAEYAANNVTATAFAAHTDERYARDEIQGNGLSGPYRLTGRDIVPNSDKLRIEVRDRFRSEQIVSSQLLTRHIDYDIDTVMGTIRFREPVMSRDPSLNPIFIVVDYETYGVDKRTLAGGRAAALYAGGKVEVGVTGLRDQTQGAAALIAVDARVKPTANTEIRAEAATGGRTGLDGGVAWLVEGEHHGSSLDILAYARQQDVGFGVGQQNVVEAGSRKVGIDGRLRITDKLSLAGTAWHQDQLVGTGNRTAADARLELRRATGTLYAGAQVAYDRGIDGRNRSSQLLTLGGTQAVLGDKLTVGGQTQFAIGGKDSVDFPVRHQVTAAYRITPGIRLIGGYEVSDGKEFDTQTAQVGFDVAPWTGAKLTGTVNRQGFGQQISENGQRTFAQYGLTQSLPIGQRWTVDATLDASSTMHGKLPAGAVVSPLQPVASGGSLVQDGANGDYAAMTLGAAYRGDAWSWNGRGEYRNSDTGNRFGITSNVLRALGEGKTLAGGVRWYQLRDKNGATASYATADVSLAWRPLDSKWAVLERLSLRNERADKGFSDTNVLGVPAYGNGFQSTLRAINNLAVNYRSGDEGEGHGFEATVYHGAKWVRGSFGSDDYSGFTDVTGFDLRRDIGKRFDIGIQGSVQHAWTRHTVSFSGGPTVGVSPAPNVWITAGYNVSGYRDRDFEEDRYTRKGPFITMRLKFDRDSIAGAGRSILGIR